LSSQHSRLAGILVDAFDPGRAAILDAIQARLCGAGYATVIAATGGGGARAVSAARAMAAREVEGIFLVGTEADAALEALLAERRIPCVAVDGGGTTQSQATVCASYAAGGAVAGAYLLGLGHQRLAFIGDATNHPWRRTEMLQGLRGALTTSRAMLPPERVLACTIHAVDAALRQWLAAAAPPTALVCGDDLLALAVLQACALRGIVVPDQLSVVGCGDLPFAAHASPALSTLRIPGAAVGAAAVDQLLERLAGGAPTGRSIPVKLVIRRSSGPAPVRSAW
jgi:LacI family transcriptional regulator, galactose operon repressor